MLTSDSMRLSMRTRPAQAGTVVGVRLTVRELMN